MSRRQGSKVSVGVMLALVASTLPGAAWAARADGCAGAPVRYDGIERATGVSPVCLLPGGTDGTALAEGEALRVSIYRRSAPADGRSQVRMVLEALDAGDRPLARPVRVTLEASLGRLLTQDLYFTRETPRFLADRDRREPGIQVEVRDGRAEVVLVAPHEPGDALVRASSGKARVEGVVSFVPDLRPALAVGLVEGIVSVDRIRHGVNTPTIANDGLEAELSNLAGGDGADGTHLRGRAAFFVKRTWRDRYLVTGAYDSDKDRIRLFRDIQPDQFYPIYGDASLKGFDAQSTRRGYLRIDQDKSFLLFGDYMTESSASDARSLGLYSRSLTGGKYHLEQQRLKADLWAARDAVRQVIDEQPGRGISGPYAVSSSGGLSQSEKVEIIVRDRNQPAVILQATPLVRFTDYEFEPFTGRLLFHKPVPSLDERLNPVSIRVTYEVERDGPESWVAGTNLQWRVGERLELGASHALDDDPAQPYGLSSVNATWKFGSHTTWLVEAARSDRDATLSQPGATGDGLRTEFRHQGGKLDARLFYGTTDRSFDNPMAQLTSGRNEASGRVVWHIDGLTDLTVEALQSYDNTVDAARSGAQVALGRWFTDWLHLEGGLRYFDDEVSGSLPLQSTTRFSSVYNFQTPGSLPVGAYQNGGLASGRNTTARLKATTRVGKKALVYAEAEQGLEDTDAGAWAVGGQYQVFDQARLYLRHEYADSLAGYYGLNKGEHREATVFGVDSAYMQDGTVFSEYRLRDAMPGREGEAAVGLRNLWPVREGLAFSTAVERIQSVAGEKGEATALSAGVEYTRSERLKASARGEFRDDQAADTYLSTVAVTGKVSRDFSVLARNVYSDTRNRDAAQGQHLVNRAIVGWAYRDTDTNIWNALMRYEFKVERDTAAADPSSKGAHIVSLHTSYKPFRPLTVSTQVATKRVDEKFGGTRASYDAWLASGRMMYDLTERWDTGIQVSQLSGGRARQYGLGLESGYAVIDNLWVSVGYNLLGFSDDDLVESNYTRRGVYLRLRYKFDEKLFSGRDRAWNNSLPR